jgi:hypothetical protein
VNTIFDLLAQVGVDNAFRDKKDLDVVIALKPNPNKLCHIHWKDSVLDKYVLRNVNHKLLKRENFNLALKGYTNKEGYECLTSYTIHRFVVNKLSSKWFNFS